MKLFITVFIVVVAISLFLTVIIGVITDFCTNSKVSKDAGRAGYVEPTEYTLPPQVVTTPYDGYDSTPLRVDSSERKSIERIVK